MADQTIPSIKNLRGNIGIGLANPATPLAVKVTSGNLINLGSSAPASTLQVGSASSTLFAAIGSRQSNTSQSGLGIMTSTPDASTATYGDMFFSVRKNNDSDFGTTASKKAFSFLRYTTSLMTILRDGKVGIGTTSPSTPLHVKGNIRAEASGSTAFADLKSSQIYASSTYDLIVGTNNPLFFRTNDERRMTILGGGNVGIGTTSPVSKLTVESSANALADVDEPENHHLLLRNPANDTTEGVGMGFLVSALTVDVGASILCKRVGPNAQSELQFWNKQNTTSDGVITQSMTIAEDGNLGIGVTDPSFKLDVGTATGGAIARFKDTDSSHEGIIIQGDTNGGSITNAAAFTKEVIYLQNSLNAIRLYTNGGERVRIASNGLTTFYGTGGGALTIGSHIDLGDNQQVRLGASDDLTLYHEPSGENSYIDNHTGDLFIRNNSNDSVIIGHNADKGLMYVPDGRVELRFNDSKKFETTDDGVKVTGDVLLTNGNYIIFDGPAPKTTKMRSYYDGSQAHIAMTVANTAVLDLRADGLSTFSGDVVIGGGLTINGTTTTINSTTLQVDDKNIELGTVASPSDTTADGGGITLKGASDYTINWTNSTNSWHFNQGITVGANGTGHDVVFYGDTSDRYLTWDQSADRLNLRDHVELTLGTHNDLRLWYNNVRGRIAYTGGNEFQITASNTLALGYNDNDGVYGETAIVCYKNGAVKIRHDNSQKFTTTSGGVDITGALGVSTNLNVSGYGTLAGLDINGNSQFDGAVTVGVDDTGHDVIFYGATASRYLKWNQAEDRLNLRDNTKLSIGNSNDLQLEFNGTHGYIKNNVGGSLYIQTANTIQLENSSGQDMLTAASGGAVRLFYGGNSTAKLETTSSGVSVTGLTINGSPQAGEVRFTRSGINNSTYTMLCTVAGDNLASIIDMTITGTSSNVVLNSSFEILVNHYQDIHVKSVSGDYKEVTLRITSNENEDFSIEAKHNGSTTTTIEVCIFPRAGETITPTSTDPNYTGTEYEHTATEGFRFGGTDGTTESSNLIVDGKIGIGTASPTDNLEVQNSVGNPMLHLRPNAASTNATVNPIILYRNQLNGSANYMLSAGINTFFGTYNGGVPTDESEMIKLSPSSSDAPSVRIGDAGSTASYLQVGGNIKLLNNGDSYITGGDVGIGTTSPDSPLELEVATAGNTQTRLAHFDHNPTGNTGSGFLRLSSGSNNNSSLHIEQVSSGGGSLYGTYSDTNFINNGTQTSGAYNNINFVTNEAIRMTIGGGSQAGNVGIGTTTPSRTLHVVDSAGPTIKFQRSASSDLEFTFGTANASIISAGEIQFRANGGTTNKFIINNSQIQSNAKLLVNTNSGIDVHTNDTGTIIKSGNSSATSTPDQFFVNHSAANVDMGNNRGNIKITKGILNPMFSDQGGGLGLEAMRWSYYPASSDYYLSLATEVPAGGVVRYHWNMKNNGTAYDDVMVFDRGNVHIGGTDLTAKLSIRDDGSLTQDIVHIKGGGSSGNFDMLKVEANNGDDIFRVNAQTYHVLMPDSDTKVGIGTSSPDGLLMIRKDQTAPTKLIISNGGTAGADTSSRLSFYEGTSEKSYIERKRDGSGITKFHTPATDNPIQWTNATGEYMRFVGGNVGIGTASPQRALEISAAGTSGGGIMRLTSTGETSAGDAVGKIEFYNSDTTDHTAGVMASIKAIAGPSGGEGHLQFLTDMPSEGAEANQVALHLHSNANVGIGTTSPTSKLEVSSFGAHGINISQDLTASTLSGRLFLSNGTTNQACTLFNSGGTLRFATGGHIGNSSGDTRMTLLADGKLGVGTTSPLGTVHIFTADAGAAIATNTSHDDLIIENGGNCGIQLSGPANSYQYLAFGDTASANQGYVRYYHTDNRMDLRAGGTDTLSLVGGKAGLGTTSPTDKLHVYGSVRGDMKLEGNFTAGQTDVAKFGLAYLPRGGDHNNRNIALIGAYNTTTDSTSGGDLRFHTRATNSTLQERVRIQQDGKIGIGTTSVNTGVGIQVANGAIYATNGDAYLDTINAGYFASTRTLNLKSGASGQVILTTGSNNQLKADSGGFVELSHVGSTSGGKFLTRRYSGNDYLNVFSSEYSSGSLCLGYGAAGKSGAAGFVSTYDNFEGHKSIFKVNHNGITVITTGNAAVDTVGADLSMAERFSVQVDKAYFATGNVGIGTTSPSTLLHLSASDPVLKITDTSGSDNGATLWLQESDSFGAKVKYESNSNTFFKISTVDGGTETDRFSIKRTGEIGIGTTSPLVPLHVQGTALSGYVSGDVNADTMMVIENDDNARLAIVAGSLSDLLFGDASDQDVGRIRYNHSSDSMAFFTAGAECMRIKDSGDVGIGTTSPNYLLDVEKAGAAIRVYNLTDNGNTDLRMMTVGTEGQCRIFFGDTADSNVGSIIYRHNGNSLAFETNDAEAVRIDSSGQVGIGTTSPQQELDVDGVIKQKVYTLSSLPSASSSTIGARAFISDSAVQYNSSNIGQQAAYGGGSYFVPVYSDGSYWYIG